MSKKKGFLVKIPDQKRRIRTPPDAYLITPPKYSFELEEGYLPDGTWSKEIQPYLVYYGRTEKGFPMAVTPKWLTQMSENRESDEKIPANCLFRETLEGLIGDRCCNRFHCANGKTVPDDETLFEQCLQLVINEEIADQTSLIIDTHEEVKNLFERGMHDLFFWRGHFECWMGETLLECEKVLDELTELASKQKETLLKIRKSFKKQCPKIQEKVELHKVELLTTKEGLVRIASRAF